MEAVLPIMLAMAMEAERLTIGRGKELATQETMIWSVMCCRQFEPRKKAVGEALTCRDCTHGHQKHGKKACPNIGRRGGDGVAHRCDEHKADDVNGSVPCPGGRPRHKNGDEERCELTQSLLVKRISKHCGHIRTYPNRSGQPQRIDGAISQSPDNGREEILKRLAQQTDVLEQDKQIQPIVLQSKLQPVHCRPLVALVLLVNIG